jgi:protein involved in polysaccharide export with SLBB domain
VLYLTQKAAEAIKSNRLFLKTVRLSRSRIALLALLAGCWLNATQVLAQQQGLESDENGLGASDSNGPGGEQVRQLLGQLNVSTGQLRQMQEQGATGGEGKPQIQSLCASMTAKHMSSEEAQSVGTALGMTDDDIAKLVECTRSVPTESGLMPGTQASDIEKQYHAADSPYRELVAPQLNVLNQFGYDLFNTNAAINKSASFDNVSPGPDNGGKTASFDNVPVGPDYVVGPGDTLNILLWGRINRTLSLTVQRDGTVQVPQVGPLPIAGLSFAEAQKLIDSQMTQIEGVQTDVTMGRLRTIEVYVIGQVEHPGLQRLSALAHVSDALTIAGGARKTGSLRRVEVRREGHPAAVVDLYEMLLRGDTSNDVRLQPRDVVFVPVIGPVVGVAGNVKNPAIYELRGRETLADAIRMAGGVSAFGYAQRVQVERIQNHARRVMLDVALNYGRSSAFAVGDGDLVKVFPVLPEEQNVVKLAGNVNRPGSYEWRDGMRVSDLVRLGQGLHDGTFLDYALLKRREGVTHTVHFLKIELGDALAGAAGADLMLTPEDSLTVYSVGEMDQIPTVSVDGPVRKPGTYPLTKGMRVSDLVYEAGGLEESAYLTAAQLARLSSDGSTAHQVLSTFNLKAAMDGAVGDDVSLKRSDTLLIAEASNWHAPWVVQVKGQVMRPGPYVIREGETLTSVLERCGGIRFDGFMPALILTRRSVRQMQQQELDRASAQVQTQITRAALIPAENDKVEQASLQQKAEALLMLKNMIESSDQKMAIGRIVLNINSLAELQGSPSDIALEEHDEIVVPKRPASVNVIGQVHGATAVLYDPALTVRDYIDRAGGFSEIADKDEMFVVKANGAIVSESGYEDSHKGRIFPLLPLVSGGLMNAHLGPGDTIYVPPQFLFINPIQRTLDVTQIIANSAEGIAYAALLGTLL